MHLYPNPQYNGPAVIMWERSYEWGGSCDIWAMTFDMESEQAKSCKKKGGGLPLSPWRGRVKRRKWVKKQGTTKSQTGLK